MRTNALLVIALLFFVLSGSAKAELRRQFAVATPVGEIPVDAFVSGENGPRPAVLILSGSRGFAAPAYDEIGRAFLAAGLDAYLVHVLSKADRQAIANASSARSRVDYYAKRRLHWIAAVHGVVSYLGKQPRHARRIGLLGISLGAQTAAAASIGRPDIGAMVLVDGGFPNGYSPPVRSMPPTLLIWGGDDRVFPLAIGKKARDLVRRSGSSASLVVFEDGAHDFFLKPGTRQARAAYEHAARFLVSALAR